MCLTIYHAIILVLDDLCQGSITYSYSYKVIFVHSYIMLALNKQSLSEFILRRASRWSKPEHNPYLTDENLSKVQHQYSFSDVWAPLRAYPVSPSGNPSRSNLVWITRDTTPTLSYSVTCGPPCGAYPVPFGEPLESILEWIKETWHLHHY
jgi:hypothetical protein